MLSENQKNTLLLFARMYSMPKVIEWLPIAEGGIGLGGSRSQESAARKAKIEFARLGGYEKLNQLYGEIFSNPEMTAELKAMFIRGNRGDLLSMIGDAFVANITPLTIIGGALAMAGMLTLPTSPPKFGNSFVDVFTPSNFYTSKPVPTIQNDGVSKIDAPIQQQKKNDVFLIGGIAALFLLIGV